MSETFETFRNRYNSLLRRQFGETHDDIVVAERYRQHLKLVDIFGADGEILMEKDARGRLHLRLRPNYRPSQV